MAHAWGGAEVPADSPEALAKACTNAVTGSTSYWLRRATHGPDSGFLYNPQSPTFNAAQARSRSAALGKGRYEFRKVSERAYRLYRKFMLPPHNPAMLRNAERS